MEIAGVFYGHLEYFLVIWYILWPFGNVVVIWYIFPRFGILRQELSGNPGLNKRNITNVDSLNLANTIESVLESAFRKGGGQLVGRSKLNNILQKAAAVYLA
jgi:hypothetical protein